MSAMTDRLPEWAFYYPNPVWSKSNWLKNLILFFDGIVLLSPEFARASPFEGDENVASRLQEDGLLQIVDLSAFVDPRGAKTVADALTDLIASGALDELAARPTAFQALAYSQFGYMSDGGMAEIIYKELHARGIGSQGAAGLLHPIVRSLLLVMLAQLLRPAGWKQGMYLCPATDRRELHGALTEVLGVPSVAAAAPVVSLDMQPVGVDLSAVPIDEVLAFRGEHREAYQRFTRNLRGFVHQTVDSPDDEAGLAARTPAADDGSVGRAPRERRQRLESADGVLARAHRRGVVVGPGRHRRESVGPGADMAEPPSAAPTRAGAFSYLFSDEAPT